MFIKKVLLLFCVFCLISCKNNIDLDESGGKMKTILFKNQDPEYLKNPLKSDTLCLNDITRAKTDLKNFGKFYVETICFGCDSKPFEKELDEILQKRKIKKVIESFDCVVYEGQTDGCYRGYILNEMKRKYGNNYISEIENQAEKLMIQNIINKGKVLSVYDLKDSEKPKILSKGLEIDTDHFNSDLKVDFPFEFSWGKSLFVDINFVNEKNGTISNIKTDNWVNDFPSNERLKDKMINFAIGYLKKKCNKWKPGFYKGVKVRTENNLRINFIPMSLKNKE